VPPYQLGGLTGQTAAGTGFSGKWTLALSQDLTVISPGIVGRPQVTAGNSGDCAEFAAPISIAGQLFISFDMANQLTSNLSSTRPDLVNVHGSRVYVGAFGSSANINLALDPGLGTSTTAQTQIPSTGSHRIVGVLDVAGQQIAIFVDPTGDSYYSSAHGNNADAVAPWIPSGTLAFQSYCLIENLADQVNFSHVAFATSAAVVTKIE